MGKSEKLIKFVKDRPGHDFRYSVNYSKLKKLGWKPKYDLAALVKEMVQADLSLFKRDKYLLDGGHDILQYHE